MEKMIKKEYAEIEFKEFVAYDGKRFATDQQCLQYERYLFKKHKIKTIWRNDFALYKFTNEKELNAYCSYKRQDSYFLPTVVDTDDTIYNDLMEYENLTNLSAKLIFPLYFLTTIKEHTFYVLDKESYDRLIQNSVKED